MVHLKVCCVVVLVGVGYSKYKFGTSENSSQRISVNCSRFLLVWFPQRSYVIKIIGLLSGAGIVQRILRYPFDYMPIGKKVNRTSGFLFNTNKILKAIVCGSICELVSSLVEKIDYKLALSLIFCFFFFISLIFYHSFLQILNSQN